MRSAIDGEQRHVVLDDEQARAGHARGCAGAAGRAPRPRAGRCPTTARRAGAPVGRWASTQARSTTRRLPVESSRTYLSGRRPGRAARSAPRPGRSPSASESTTDGQVQRGGQAGRGRRCSRSSATAIVSATVRAGNSRPSWNERPSPRRARASGPSPMMSVAVEPHVALVGGQEAGEDVEEGGLAGAVRAQEAEDLAGAHVEATRRRARRCRRSASTRPRPRAAGRRWPSAPSALSGPTTGAAVGRRRR